ncbi:MAG: hypothetical protein K8R74_14270 [Bacteroidales bacterium]|nr:hypothetical protein [Bacteroidales bacterium]
MNFNLISEYPLWFIILCIVLGVGYAAILYYKETKNEFTVISKWVMAIFRMLVISIISFLLLNPLIKTISRYADKPVILFAQDNSMSIVTGTDSNVYRQDYIENLNQLFEQIGSNNKIDKYTFGDKIGADFNIDYSDKQTDISNLFSELSERYSHKNVGGLIVASDGIYNRGVNPLYSSNQFNFPVYTIALGDTNLQKDIIINKVNYNRIAYLGNEFPIEIIINSNKCKGLSSEVIIIKDDSIKYRKRITFDSDNHFETLKLKLLATEPGLQKYRIRVSAIDKEISRVNNSQDIYIDILEGRQKILILANSPHPDITALKEAIISNKNYEVDYFKVDNFDLPVQAYNLVILHGLPSIQYTAEKLLDDIRKNQLPVLYILSKQTFMPIFNQLKSGLIIEGESMIYNEATPVYNENFSLFNLSESTIEISRQFPPLISPYGNFNLQPSVNNLFYQQIGSIETNEPLFVLNQTLDLKSGIIVGTGIWKWRLNNFAKYGNHYAFNEIINKTVQYLSLKLDKSFFRVFSKNDFFENENIEFDAEVYNESYELINDPEVTLTISDNKGKRYPYVFSKTGDAYYLNTGSLPAGNYSYLARVQVGDKLFTETGEFSVKALNIENINTLANHNLLYNLAVNNGGEMVYPGQLDYLATMINSREDIKTIMYTQKRYTELLNFPWILILTLFLLTAEWFMRKRAGGY